MNNNTSRSTSSYRSNFYSGTTVVIIISVLGLALVIVYLYNMYKEYNAKLVASRSEQVAPMCPNYWDSLGNDKCQNTHRLGSCANEPGAEMMDFSGPVFNNKNTGNYARCKWAKACNVSWSGIDRLC